MSKRGEKAYNLRVLSTGSWSKIAQIVGYSCWNSAQRGAKSYALASSNLWPLVPSPSESLSFGKDCYDYRMMYCYSWKDVSKDIGHKNALYLASRYAKKMGLRWPLPLATKGAKIYAARKVGMTWLSIAISYSQTIEQVKDQSYKWSIRHKRVWPPSV